MIYSDAGINENPILSFEYVGILPIFIIRRFLNNRVAGVILYRDLVSDIQLNNKI